MNVWAFAQISDDRAKEKLVQSLKEGGKSRFGWSQKDEHNLLLENNWTDWHSRQLFLRQIKKGDWIVHINTPSYGRCIAVQVKEEYSYDAGIDVNDDGEWIDFRHCFEIDKESLIEFERRDNRVDPRVNLRPRQRYHRVYAIKEFDESMERIRANTPLPERSAFLHKATDGYLKEITQKIHDMNKGKELESFLAEVYRRNTSITVNENGSGWRTDNGADLILTLSHSINNLQIENIIVVQIKSYEGKHNNIFYLKVINTMR